MEHTRQAGVGKSSECPENQNIRFLAETNSHMCIRESDFFD